MLMKMLPLPRRAHDAGPNSWRGDQHRRRPGSGQNSRATPPATDPRTDSYPSPWPSGRCRRRRSPDIGRMPQHRGANRRVRRLQLVRGSSRRPPRTPHCPPACADGRHPGFSPRSAFRPRRGRLRARPPPAPRPARRPGRPLPPITTATSPVRSNKFMVAKIESRTVGDPHSRCNPPAPAVRPGPEVDKVERLKS
jgi:hypothetical protein